MSLQDNVLHLDNKTFWQLVFVATIMGKASNSNYSQLTRIAAEVADEAVTLSSERFNK